MSGVDCRCEGGVRDRNNSDGYDGERHAECDGHVNRYGNSDGEGECNSGIAGKENSVGSIAVVQTGREDAGQ